MGWQYYLAAHPARRGRGCAERRRRRDGLADRPARRAGLGGDQAARLARGGRGSAGRGHPDRGRRHPGRPGRRGGQETGPGHRVPGRDPGAGAAVRRGRAVPRLRRLDGASQRRKPSQAPRPGVPHRLGDHGRAQPGRHRGAAHPGGVRHRGAAGGAGQAARVRVHAPGQLGVPAAPGVQPDQPAGVRGQRAGLRPVRRADGGALAGRHRRRVRGVRPVLRVRPEHRRPGGSRPGQRACQWSRS